MDVRQRIARRQQRDPEAHNQVFVILLASVVNLSRTKGLACWIRKSLRLGVGWRFYFGRLTNGWSDGLRPRYP